MKIAYLISVYLHILSAMFWIGGTLFFILIAVPAIQKATDKNKLFEKIGIRFRLYSWVALSTLFITGLFNFYIRGMRDFSFFHGSHLAELYGFKFILFFVIVLIAAIHDFYVGMKALSYIQEDPDNVKTKQLSTLAKWMGRINFLFALLMFGLGVVIVRGWG